MGGRGPIEVPEVGSVVLPMTTMVEEDNVLGSHPQGPDLSKGHQMVNEVQINEVQINEVDVLEKDLAVLGLAMGVLAMGRGFWAWRWSSWRRTW